MGLALRVELGLREGLGEGEGVGLGAGRRRFFLDPGLIRSVLCWRSGGLGA